MDWYSAVLALHSWLRWVVLLTGLLAFGRAIAGGSRPWSASDDRAARLFTVSLDVQFLLGVLLYFLLSPLTQTALQDFGGAMGNPVLRFWAVEHVFGVLVGLTLAHIGAARVRKAPAERRRRLAAIFFGLALLAIVAAVPWPGLPNARPLFRW
jgi:hypothetical protein